MPPLRCRSRRADECANAGQARHRLLHATHTLRARGHQGRRHQGLRRRSAHRHFQPRSGQNLRGAGRRNQRRRSKLLEAGALLQRADLGRQHRRRQNLSPRQAHRPTPHLGSEIHRTQKVATRGDRSAHSAQSRQPNHAQPRGPRQIAHPAVFRRKGLQECQGQHHTAGGCHGR